MKGFRTITGLLLLGFLCQQIQILSVVGDVDGAHRLNENEEQPTSPPSIIQLAQEKLHLLGDTSALIEKLKGFVEMVQRDYFPPNLDFKSSDRGGGESDGDDASTRVTTAVGRSLEMSKEAAEETAKTAAEAMQKTTEKVKGSVSDSEKPNEEL